MQIILNGNSYNLQERMTLHDLVNELKCNNGSIAIALNQNVIPKTKYLDIWLKEHDKVEIVTAFQGG